MDVRRTRFAQIDWFLHVVEHLEQPSACVLMEFIAEYVHRWLGRFLERPVPGAGTWKGLTVTACDAMNAETSLRRHNLD